LEPAPETRFGRIKLLSGAPEVDLHEDADAVGTGSVGADGIEAVGVAYHYLKGGRGVQDAASDSGMPVARLLESGQIIHHRSVSYEIRAPAMSFVEGNHAIATYEDELFGADLLIIVTRQAQREFRDQRQHRS